MSKLLQNYRSECEDFIKGWIKKKTRFNHKNLALENYKNFELEFEVSVENAFRVGESKVDFSPKFISQALKKTKNGEKLLEFEFKDDKFFDEKSWKTAIDKDIKAVLEDKENFENLLFGVVENGEFGLFKEETQIGASENRFLWEHKCHKCRGEGSTKCTQCRNGRVKCTAWSCNGGRIRRKDKNGRVYYEDCDKCRGTGWKTCPTCRGSNFVQCGLCNATGTQTHTAFVVIYTQPSYEFHFSDKFDEDLKAKITEFGIENLSKIADISRTKIEKDEKAKIVREKYTLTLPVAEFSLQLKKKSYEWAVFGREIQVLKNGGVPEKNNAAIAAVIVIFVLVALCVCLWALSLFTPDNFTPQTQQNATNLEKKIKIFEE